MPSSGRPNTAVIHETPLRPSLSALSVELTRRSPNCCAMVDSSLSGASYMSETAAAIMAALLALNVLAGPGLTWWGLKLADETHEGDEHG